MRPVHARLSASAAPCVRPPPRAPPPATHPRSAAGTRPCTRRAALQALEPCPVWVWSHEESRV